MAKRLGKGEKKRLCRAPRGSSQDEERAAALLGGGGVVVVVRLGFSGGAMTI